MISLAPRWRPVAPYFGAFLGLGVALSFFGPALPALRGQTGSSLADMGLVFSAQSLGGLVGSVVAGRAYRRLGGPHLIAVALIAFAGAMALLPWSSELWVVILLGAVIGAGAGTIDVGGNTLLPGIVEPEALVSSINALHMCFAVGALATPLVVGLSEGVASSLWPACLVIAFGTFALGTAMWSGDRSGAARQAQDDHAERGDPTERWRLAVVALFFVLYVGLEIGYAGWIATYSGELGFATGWATAITAAFWAGFLIGRLFMVWRGDRFETGRVLWISVIAATVLAAAVAMIGAQTVPLLVLSTLFGIAIAPQFPTMLAHVHRSVPLTGVVTAWCIAGSATGGLVLPWVIGELIESVGVGAMPWTVAGASAGSAAVVFAVDRWALAAPSGPSKQRDPAAAEG